MNREEIDQKELIHNARVCFLPQNSTSFAICLVQKLYIFN